MAPAIVVRVDADSVPYRRLSGTKLAGHFGDELHHARGRDPEVLRDLFAPFLGKVGSDDLALARGQVRDPLRYSRDQLK